MSFNTSDLNAIERIVREVPGVRDAAALIDLRLKAGQMNGVGHDVPAVAGRPIPDTVPAIVHGPEPVLPDEAITTLPEALLSAAARVPHRGITYVRSDCTTDRQTYAELLREALLLLGGLRDIGLRPGDSVMVHNADHRRFVTTWWACALGGLVPTAVGAVRDYSGENAAVRKLHAAWTLLDHPVVVTDADLCERVAALAGRWEEGEALRCVSSESLLALGKSAQPHAARPDEPALNLLTSGSTGIPKCVHHTHRSLIARTYAANDATGFTADEVTLNWMPLDHVGGMVMSILRDLILGCEHVNAPTEMVIRRPLALLDLVDRYRITNTWAPNFAFSLVTRCAAQIETGHWDLSCFKHICNAGEAVVPRTAHRFLELLTPHGLPADAMVPCWGMSETCSGITYSRMDARDASVGTISLDPASLEGALVELPYGSVGSVRVCEVGAPIAGISLRIVDDAGEILPEGRIGRLHVRGTALFREYLRNEAANAVSFTSDGWFDTGDLGFLRNGRLFLTGRKKHMVIVNGLNYPAHEVEAAVEQVPSVRAGCTAVCAVRVEEDDTDGIAVFFVPADESLGDMGRVLAEIRAALATDLALRAKWLIPLNEAEFPRVGGGKVQRERLIEGLRTGRFAGRMYAGEATTEAPDEDALLELVWLPLETAPKSAGRAGSTLLYAPAGWRNTPGDGMAVITSAAAFNVLGERHVEADLTDAEQQHRALTHLLSSIGRPDHIVYATEAGTWEEGDESGPAARFMVSVAAISRAVPGADVTVLVSDTVGVQLRDRVLPSRATLPAMVRTAAAEGQFRYIGLIDAMGVPEWMARPESIPRYDADLVAIRDGRAYAPRLRRLEPLERFEVPHRFLPPGGTVLITGGLGGLGQVIAEHLLVAAGARLLIVGRTPEIELIGTPREQLLADLRALGDVRYTAVDVADISGLPSAVAEAERAWGSPLDMVLHLAAAPVTSQWDKLCAHTLDAETLPWLQDMLHPKLGGGAAIDRLLQSRPRTSVVLFSSVNAFLGGSSFGAYAAASAALHGFAHQWTARGHAVRCVDWTMWDGPGLNQGNPLVAAARHRGLRMIERGRGLSHLLAALHHPAPVVLVGIDARNPHITPHLAADEFESSGIVVAVAAGACIERERIRHDVGAALAARGVFARVIVLREFPLDAAGGVDRVAVLAAESSRVIEFQPPLGSAEELVAAITTELLGVRQVSRDDSFFALGCDSIRAVQLAERLGARLGGNVPVSLLYENPTVRELAAAMALLRAA